MTQTWCFGRRRALVALSLGVAGALAAGPGLADSSAHAVIGTRVAASAATQRPETVNKCHRSKIDVPSCGLLWGLYTQPVPSKAGYRSDYGRFERAIGRRFDIVKAYVDWQQHVTFPSTKFASLASHRRRILYVSWNAINYDTHRVVYYRNIARGDYDKSVILPEARRLKAYHQKIFVDFNHEFDAKAQSGKGGPASYVRAYRHIHRVFQKAGVKNVIWSWVSTGYVGNLKDIKASWPGAKYVDWVGYDPYNFAYCNDAKWRSPYASFHPFYAWLRRQPGMRHKPILLGEYASAPGRHLGHWYASLASTLRRMPKIRALFQWSAPTVEHCPVSLADSASALKAFAKVSKAHYVTGR
ncbi:MAG TPA: glycosyl hydrolase [Mycobacteriales bacterium]|jgi:hypothetical protein|nr:glycosyl hydrolase [Mycobacteriales bacterium]